MKKVVVTGPTGVIGSAVIKKLIAENCKVYAVIRKTSKRIANIIKHDNVKIIYCDVAEVKLLPEKIGENCDIFYHLAWTGTDNPANRMNMYNQIENVRYALDAAEALWAMAEKGQNGAVYVLGSGQNITLEECVELIKDELHSDVKIEYGVIPYYADQVMFMQADIKALTADTGWRPQTPFRQGIRKLLEYVAERNDV